jgi:uncharacterized caspase-like protein
MSLASESESASESQKIAALFVGIDEYQGDLRLGGCVRDATRVAEAFRPLLKRGTVLADERCSQRGILSELRNAVSSADPGDLVVFYFAGHGWVKYGNFFLCPLELDAACRYGTVFPFRTVVDILNAGTLDSLIVLDACHAGGVGFDLSTFEGKTSILVSAAPGEKAHEVEIGGSMQGAFTYALTSTLNDYNASGSPLSLIELFERTYRETTKRTSGKQHPILIGTLNYDLPLTGISPG